MLNDAPATQPLYTLHEVVQGHSLGFGHSTPIWQAKPCRLDGFDDGSFQLGESNRHAAYSLLRLHPSHYRVEFK